MATPAGGSPAGVDVHEALEVPGGVAQVEDVGHGHAVRVDQALGLLPRLQTLLEGRLRLPGAARWGHVQEGAEGEHVAVPQLVQHGAEGDLDRIHAAHDGVRRRHLADGLLVEPLEVPVAQHGPAGVHAHALAQLDDLGVRPEDHPVLGGDGPAAVGPDHGRHHLDLLHVAGDVVGGVEAPEEPLDVDRRPAHRADALHASLELHLGLELRGVGGVRVRHGLLRTVGEGAILHPGFHWSSADWHGGFLYISQQRGTIFFVAGSRKKKGTEQTEQMYASLNSSRRPGASHARTRPYIKPTRSCGTPPSPSPRRTRTSRT